nr:unnamed protein product [Callosobruchus analis]
MKLYTPEQLLLLYKAQFRPSLEYCSHVWGCAPKHSLKLLDSILKRAVRLIDTPILTKDLHSRGIEEGSHGANAGEVVRFDVRGVNTTAIDLNFCSPQLSHRLTWRTLDDHNFSDHWPIILSTDIAKVFFPSFRKWLIKSGAMGAFSEAIWIAQLPDDPDTAADTFADAIRRAAEGRIAKSSGSTYLGGTIILNLLLKIRKLLLTDSDVILLLKILSHSRNLVPKLTGNSAMLKGKL